MKEFNAAQIGIIREKITKAIVRNGFERNIIDSMLPAKLTNNSVNTRLNMFLAIGINTTGRTNVMNNVMTFVIKGINRFFRSLSNRRELAEIMFRENVYPGKYNLSADYYIAPAVFDVDEIPDDVLNEWNSMMKCIRIRNRHGIKVERVRPNKAAIDTVKYNWVDRGMGPIRTPKASKKK